MIAEQSDEWGTTRRTTFGRGPMVGRSPSLLLRSLRTAAYWFRASARLNGRCADRQTPGRARGRIVDRDETTGGPEKRFSDHGTPQKNPVGPTA
jgi:hypothetical protein